MSNLKLIISGDGSSTLYNEAMDETYHSQHGAITESRHIFIDRGLKALDLPGKEISILEVGLGTGLNVLLSVQYMLGKNTIVRCHSLEPFPLEAAITSTLNYEKEINDVRISGCLQQIHDAPWEMGYALTENFILYKNKVRLEEFVAVTNFDLVYFDAFAPSKQPEIWNEENFVKLHSIMRAGALLVSYCASGQFRRNLKSAGFAVESLPGPPGKKEITRAQK